MQDDKKKTMKSERKAPSFSFDKSSPDEGNIFDVKLNNLKITLQIFASLTEIPLGYLNIASKSIDIAFAVTRGRLIWYPAQSDDAFQQLVVANLYFNYQIKKSRQIAIVCLASTVSIFALHYFLAFAISISTVMILFISLVTLIYARAALIAYRISNGYFGSNRDEVTDLIFFIVDNSDDVGSSGGNQMKGGYLNKEQVKGQESVDGLEGAGA